MTPRILIAGLFAPLLSCQGAGVILYHEPVANYVELVSFQRFPGRNCLRYRHGARWGQRQLWNSGIVARIDTPVVGQDVDPKSARKEIKQIRTLYRKISRLPLPAWQAVYCLGERAGCSTAPCGVTTNHCQHLFLHPNIGCEWCALRRGKTHRRRWGLSIHHVFRWCDHHPLESVRPKRRSPVSMKTPQG